MNAVILETIKAAISVCPSVRMNAESYENRQTDGHGYRYTLYGVGNASFDCYILSNESSNTLWGRKRFLLRCKLLTEINIPLQTSD